MSERFDYLTPAQGPVIGGLENIEKIFALEQAEYLPIRTLQGENGHSAIYRCELTEAQRRLVAEGADVLVEILHFGGPSAPSRVMLLNQQGLSAEHGEKDAMANWMRAQLKLERSAPERI